MYLVKLVSRSQARRSGSNNGNLLASSELWWIGLDPSLVKCVVDDGALDVLDGDGRLVDAEDTGALAGGGAHSPSELGEVVGLGQLVQRLPPVAVEHKVVELGDDVAEGAAVRGGVAEGNAAVHAGVKAAEPNLDNVYQ